MRCIKVKGLWATLLAALAMALALALAGCSVSAVQGSQREVQDMAGRTVTIPETVERVFCTNPIGTADVFALSPESLVGWNFLPAGDNRKYIPDEMLELPALGVWMGAGSVPNAEEIAAQNPDVLLCYWTADEVGASMADDIQAETRIPTLVIDYDIRSTPKMFRYVGELLGCEDRAEELAVFSEGKLDDIREIAASVTDNERKSIFLAQGNDGLTTDPVGSMHVQDALDLIAVTNVADMPGTEGKGMGMPSVNLEQILTWDPDALLVVEFNMSNAESSDIYSGIVADSHWQTIPCVEEGEVYRIPQGPFSWFGRPPSVARLLGAEWLQKVLYPQHAENLNIRDEVVEFYDVMYGFDDFDDELLDNLLDSAGIDAATGQDKEQSCCSM